MAVEGQLSTGSSPIAESLLRHGLRKLSLHLPRVHQPGVAGEPRLRVTLAVLRSAKAAATPAAGRRGRLAHAIGPRSSLANRRGGGTAGPPCVAVRISHGPRLGVGDREVARYRPRRSELDRVVGAIRTSLAVLNVPTRLRIVGVTQADLEAAIHHAADDWAVETAPRLADPGQLREMVGAAW